MKANKNEPYNNKVKFETSMLTPRYLLTWMGMGFLYLLTLCPIKFQLFLGGQLGPILLFLSPQRKRIAERLEMTQEELYSMRMKTRNNMFKKLSSVDDAITNKSIEIIQSYEDSQPHKAPKPYPSTYKLCLSLPKPSPGR